MQHFDAFMCLFSALLRLAFISYCEIFEIECYFRCWHRFEREDVGGGDIQFNDETIALRSLDIGEPMNLL